MLITSSSGCGLKQMTRFVVAAGRVIVDRVHHPAENALRQPLRRAVMAEQLVQVVFAEIVVVELAAAPCRSAR